MTAKQEGRSLDCSPALGSMGWLPQTLHTHTEGEIFLSLRTILGPLEIHSVACESKKSGQACMHTIKVLGTPVKADQHRFTISAVIANWWAGQDSVTFQVCFWSYFSLWDWDLYNREFTKALLPVGQPFIISQWEMKHAYIYTHVPTWN